MGNVEKTIKNSTISVAAYVATLILSFINRKVFICYLDIKLLGYQSLFTNVFGLLSLAELGFGGIISFHLYKEIALNNKKEIGKLMYMYKWFYRFVAVVVVILGIILIPFLPCFIREVDADWSFLCLIYFIQLFGVMASYYLSYKRAIYISYQLEYKCIKIDLYTNIIFSIIQILSLIIFNNYILYLVIQILRPVVANLIISYYASIDYSYINKKYKITFLDIKKRNFISDVSNFIIHKISYAIYGGVDNIIISAILGIKMVALYGNYIVVQTAVMQVLFYRLLNPVQATIGNILYSGRSKKELYEQFKVFDVFSFYFASYIGIGFFVFFQPFISLWLGIEYLLPNSFVVLLSITIYFSAIWEIVWKYRSCFGDYKQDRWFMLSSAILNIIVSVIAAEKFGISGIQFGTLVAYFPIAIGRIRFVVKNYFGQNMVLYLLKHLSLFILVLFEGLICFLIIYKLNLSLVSWIIRIAVWLFVPLIINTILFFNSKYFKLMVIYLLDVFGIIKLKIKSKVRSN